MHKKILLGLLVIVAGCLSAQAQQLTNAQSVKIVVPYQTTCSSSTIGTTITEMSGNTSASNTTGGISSIAIWNLNTSGTVCCSHNSSVSCTDGSSTYGVPIVGTSGQKNFIEWSISTMQKWYCIGDSTNASVMTCKIR